MNVGDLFHLNKDYGQISWVAGREGNTRQIRDIDILELPDGMYWVEEGDFIITMGYFLTTSDVRFENFVRMLISHKASGLGVKLGRFFDEIPEKALKLAEENQFPIINYPLHMRYKAMTHPVLNYLTGEEQYTGNLLKEYKKKLDNLVKEGYEIAAIMENLKQYINHEAYLLRENLSGFIYRTTETGSLEAKKFLMENRFNVIGTEEGRGNRTSRGGFFIYRVGAKEQTLAFLSIPDRADRILSETDVEIIKETLPYVIIHLYSETKLGQYIERSKENFFMDILDGNYDKREAQMNRDAKTLGLISDVSRCFAGIPVVGMTTTEVERMFRKIGLYLDSCKFSYTLYFNGGRISILLELNKKAESSKAVEQYFKELVQALRDSFRNDRLFILVSKIYTGFKEVAFAFEELEYMASCTLDGRQPVYYYEDYVMDHLLRGMKNQAVAGRIYKDVMKKLERYDKMNKSEMKHTLAMLAANDYNLSRTAEKMFVHRNTLYKRVERMESILGFDLGQPDTKLLLQLLIRLEETENEREL